MLCPYCKADDDKVVDSRGSEGGSGIRRRRECLKCGRRFTSYERLEEIPVMVLKRNGSRERFDLQKVLNSVKIACRKRPVSQEQIQDLATRVEIQALSSENREISSRIIGDSIISELEQLDAVALVRFSSVYREYSDVDQFVDYIRTLKKVKGQG